ncbi:MAG: membrane-bound lytic murein transglycosylase B [Pseudohongiellaceae bacterium]|jgi:membrane-bound lytic murein transglycosylase B
MSFTVRLMFILVFCFPAHTYADYLSNQDTQVFIDDMVEKHQFDKSKLQAIFKQAEKKESILKAISRPAEKRLEWLGYRKIFLTSDRAAKGKAFIKKYRDIFERAEETYGVPAHIIAAVIGVETRYGQHKGSYRVIDALSTLGFDYPPRSKFFKSELEQVLLLSREQGFEPLDLKGSYAGAMGFGQFIPSSYRHYAVDFDGDKIVDILNNPVDAIGSVANYFKMHKWQANKPVAFQVKVSGSGYKVLINKKLKPKNTLAEIKAVGIEIPEQYDLSQIAKLQELQGENGPEYWVTLQNFYVITRYNHSHLYAMAVFQLANELLEK